MLSQTVAPFPLRCLPFSRVLRSSFPPPLPPSVCARVPPRGSGPPGPRPQASFPPPTPPVGDPPRTRGRGRRRPPTPPGPGEGGGVRIGWRFLVVNVRELWFKSPHIISRGSCNPPRSLQGVQEVVRGSWPTETTMPMSSSISLWQAVKGPCPTEVDTPQCGQSSRFLSDPSFLMTIFYEKNYIKFHRSIFVYFFPGGSLSQILHTAGLPRARVHRGDGGGGAQVTAPAVPGPRPPGARTGRVLGRKHGACPMTLCGPKVMASCLLVSHGKHLQR